jgi:hypothetical protein
MWADAGKWRHDEMERKSFSRDRDKDRQGKGGGGERGEPVPVRWGM